MLTRNRQLRNMPFCWCTVSSVSYQEELHTTSCYHNNTGSLDFYVLFWSIRLGFLQCIIYQQNNQSLWFSVLCSTSMLENCTNISITNWDIKFTWASNIDTSSNALDFLTLHGDKVHNSLLATLTLVWHPWFSHHFPCGEAHTSLHCFISVNVVMERKSIISSACWLHCNNSKSHQQETEQLNKSSLKISHQTYNMVKFTLSPLLSSKLKRVKFEPRFKV